MSVSPLNRRDRIAFRKYYASGETLLKLNMKLIKIISNYALSQTNPQITAEVMDVIQHITTVKTAEDILKYVIIHEYSEQETFNFLVKSITDVYN